jgi:hypothetical protein
MSEQTTTETAAKTRDYSQYETKAPSSLHKSFADYIEAKTGHKADPKIIQLALGLHGEYQASDERKAAREQEAAEREAAKNEAKAAKQGGPRSPEARELKKLKSAVGALQELDQPVPAKTSKRIAELEAILAAATGDATDVEVPEQKSDDESAPVQVQVEASNS